jgi:hypothetical protein
LPRQPNLVAITEALIKACDEGSSVARVLNRRAGFVVDQIEKDAKTSGLLKLWGSTQNFDELAGQVIVPEQIVVAISTLAGIDYESGSPVHSGLQHTYGYLFSSLKTAFGFKRDRWTKPTIERAFGISTATLRPKPEAGTLLGNATYFMGRIAFRSRPREMAMLRRLRSSVSPVAIEYPFRSLTVVRCVEQIQIHGGVHVNLQSDYVRLPYPTEDVSWLLIYSVQDSRERVSQLVSMFPVSEESVEQNLDKASFGDRVPIRTRFNSWVNDVTGQAIEGHRSAWVVSNPNREPVPVE